MSTDSRELFERCTRAWVVLSRDGDRVRLEALDPIQHPIDHALVEEVREHKASILQIVDFEETADRLVIDSTSRIGSAWPEGCSLDCAAWWDYECALQESYQFLDLEQVRQVIRDREAFALEEFNRYRIEATR